MYLITYKQYKLLKNVVEHPWECNAESDPYDMDAKLQKMIDEAFIEEGLELNLFFEVTHSPFLKGEHLYFRTRICIAARDPHLVIGDVVRLYRKDMEMVAEFTDEFSDAAAFKSVSFILTGDCDGRWYDGPA